MGGSGRKWSLGPTRRLLEELGSPHEQFPSIHIGGTNGKGSVATMVYEALRESGLRVGLYLSPHLVDVRERIVVDGRPVSEEGFAAWTTRLRPTIERCDASFFEATTAIALADFAARGADVAVVEVGLGGRLDSTNVLTPMVAGVVNVGLDHTEYLGTTLQEIAAEKAGIAKPDIPFIIGETSAELAGVLRREADVVGARVVEVPTGASYTGPLRLEGAHQHRNAAVAKVFLDALPVPLRPDDRAVTAGLAKAWLPGRLDRRGRWILDVAHNPEGMKAVVDALRKRPPPSPLHVVLGILKDKDVAGMIGELSDLADRIWLTSPPSAPEARRPEPSEAVSMSDVEIRLQWDFDRCLQEAQAGAETVLVSGSFYTVGDAMSRLPGFQPFR